MSGLGAGRSARVWTLTNRFYFDAAARSLIAADIARTRGVSCAPFSLAATCIASLERDLARAAPYCFSAAASKARCMAADLRPAAFWLFLKSPGDAELDDTCDQLER